MKKEYAIFATGKMDIEYIASFTTKKECKEALKARLDDYNERNVIITDMYIILPVYKI